MSEMHADDSAVSGRLTMYTDNALRELWMGLH